MMGYLKAQTVMKNFIKKNLKFMARIKELHNFLSNKYVKHCPIKRGHEIAAIGIILGFRFFRVCGTLRGTSKRLFVR